MNLFSPYRDHLLVRVNLGDAHRTPGGIFIPEWQRGDHDPTRAEVLAAPQGLSRAVLDYPGLDGQAYCYADLQDVPQVGDVVYLKYNSLHPELEMPQQPGVFLVALGQVVAVADAHGPQPFQGLLLCEEVYDDDVRQRPDGVRERLLLCTVPNENYGVPCLDSTSQPIIAELNPLPIPYTLRILHAGAPLARQSDVVAVGDVVVAHAMFFSYHAVKNSDEDEGDGQWMWQAPKIVIERKEYTFIPRQGVLAHAHTN